MFCWHKWSPAYDGIFAPLGDDHGYFAVCQMRECEKCGLAQVRKLPRIRSIAELKKER